MSRVFLVAAGLLALASGPVSASELRFSPEDDAAMTACTEKTQAAMREVTASGEPRRPSAAPQGPQSCIGTVSGPCMETPEGATTIGMSECLGREIDWWDQRLNTRYAALRAGMDEQSAAALRDAQRAWIAFRDAECDFHYTYWREGTIRSTFYFNCLLDMTARRVIELEQVAQWAP